MDINKKDLELFVRKNINNPLFYTISGSHLYGFPSKDSDFDIRGCHIDKTEELLGLENQKPVIEIIDEPYDFVSQELKQYILLMLKPNGNALEQLYSPFVIITSKEHRKLQELGNACICRNLYFHYKSMAINNYKKFLENKECSVKKYLYVLRAFMTGIYALENKKIEANIIKLNKCFNFNIIDKLIELKQKEKTEMPKSSALNNQTQTLISELFQRLEESYQQSKLPQIPNKEKLNEFLIKTRLKQI